MKTSSASISKLSFMCEVTGYACWLQYWPAGPTVLKRPLFTLSDPCKVMTGFDWEGMRYRKHFLKWILYFGNYLVASVSTDKKKNVIVNCKSFNLTIVKLPALFPSVSGSTNLITCNSPYEVSLKSYKRKLFSLGLLPTMFSYRTEKREQNKACYSGEYMNIGIRTKIIPDHWTQKPIWEKLQWPK